MKKNDLASGYNECPVSRRLLHALTLEWPAGRAGAAVHRPLSPSVCFARGARVLAIAPDHARLPARVVDERLRTRCKDARADARRGRRAALWAATRLALATCGLGLAAWCDVGRPDWWPERGRESMLDVGVGG